MTATNRIDPITPFFGNDEFTRLSPLRRVPVLIDSGVRRGAGIGAQLAGAKRIKRPMIAVRPGLASGSILNTICCAPSRAR